MTKKEVKIAKRNELLKAFKPNAVNLEMLNGTFNFKKKIITIVDKGISTDYKWKSKILENQIISYIEFDKPKK